VIRWRRGGLGREDAGGLVERNLRKFPFRLVSVFLAEGRKIVYFTSKGRCVVFMVR
jgi:hypothetical protein